MMLDLSIAIPTYRREQVLVETLDYLLASEDRPAEILVLDQTPVHEAPTEAALQAMAAAGKIRWLRLPEPGITAAMNHGLLQARAGVVLFLDDDIRPEPGLLPAHMKAQETYPGGLVAGRVIQPWHEHRDLSNESAEGFAGPLPASVPDFIGCNFSVRRELALALGGFDENFVRVAYRYEAEFASRYRDRGRREIRYVPGACIHHLKAAGGGTRSFGDHLATWSPAHSVGDYYFGLRTGTVSVFAVRPFRAVMTRYHLRRPWRIPATLIAEICGMAWACWLFAQGPKRLTPSAKRSTS
jgi:GT2 family glycosyltransferase